MGWEEEEYQGTEGERIMTTDFTPEDGIQLLRTMTVHLTELRRGMQAITQDLDRRALRHDLSKFLAGEFAGFARINAAARLHPYGSEEYKAGLRQEKETIELHYSRNSHHPEHGPMSFLDIIEMVCDWRAAYLGYGSQGTWEENIERQKSRWCERFPGEAGCLTANEWWLVEKVADYVARIDK